MGRTYTAGERAPLQRTQADMRLTHGSGRGIIIAGPVCSKTANKINDMAARKNKLRLNDDWKAKIQASNLCWRLAAHVEGKIELSPTQVRAAEILLRKTVPDLGRTEVTGPEGGPQVIRYEWSEPE
jgi:hypothetical protein